MFPPIVFETATPPVSFWNILFPLVSTSFPQAWSTVGSAICSVWRPWSVKLTREAAPRRRPFVRPMMSWDELLTKIWFLLSILPKKIVEKIWGTKQTRQLAAGVDWCIIITTWTHQEPCKTEKDKGSPAPMGDWKAGFPAPLCPF